MYTIINRSTDPRYNLALEEYVLKYLDTTEDIILLWQNEPSVIIGRNQNTTEEINATYIKEHNIHVVRRISGGGAVYHDFGNLNFTFVTNNLRENLNNYRKFTEPVIAALNELGVPAEFSGRNDIVVEGKKISGNAQSYHKNRMFHHGTILFNANLEMVAKVLQVSADKIASKGIKSNRSRVTNILPYLKEQVSVEQFIDVLHKYFLDTTDIDSKTIHLQQDDYDKIQELFETKYATWEWNYGESPAFEIEKSRRYEGGKISFHLNVEEGIIQNVKIFGDFLGNKQIQDVENSLIKIRFEEQHVRNALKDLDLEQYFHKITLEDVIDCIFY